MSIFSSTYILHVEFTRHAFLTQIYLYMLMICFSCSLFHVTRVCFDLINPQKTPCFASLQKEVQYSPQHTTTTFFQLFNPCPSWFNLTHG